MVLDNSPEQQPENNDIQTNDQPVVTAEEPEQSTISPGANMAASNNRTDQGRVKRQTGTQIETDNPQVLSGWVVQLGSFSNRANAQGLVTGLQAQGYPAFIEELAEDTESIFRVRVGPELKREDAETIRLSLVEKTGIKGIILTYP
jgi:cell division septation protein DedD